MLGPPTAAAAVLVNSPVHSSQQQQQHLVGTLLRMARKAAAGADSQHLGDSQLLHVHTHMYVQQQADTKDRHKLAGQAGRQAGT